MFAKNNIKVEPKKICNALEEAIKRLKIPDSSLVQQAKNEFQFAEAQYAMDFSPDVWNKTQLCHVSLIIIPYFLDYI